jgi:FADH2 O2-dependent halogenase
MHGLPMKRHYDIAVIGSGFAGSLMAMIARRQGRSVVLIERGAHPRVVIGESSTPLANLLLEELAGRYNLPELMPLTKWGSWQRTYPQLACGLKRGFSFFHHQLDTKDGPGNHEDRQLLVAASPHNAIADTHWFRADFDQFLVQLAIETGVDYFDRIRLETCIRSTDTWELTGTKDLEVLETSASFLIDATGPRGFLHRTLGLGETLLPCLPETSALYSHFSGVRPLEQTALWPVAGAPYPMDDAAVHHVFDGGWIWILNFNNGWTSAGVAATNRIATQYNLAEGAAGWQRLLKALPTVQQQFDHAQSLTGFSYTAHLSFLSSSIAGEGWAMLPTAAGFIDPLLSTGIPLTLLGVGRLSDLLRGDLGSPSFREGLSEYAHSTRQELVITAELIGALYRSMNDFAMFRAVSLLYFCAASYAETARRLHKHPLAEGFLLHNNTAFGPECHRILKMVNDDTNTDGKAELQRSIYSLIEPFDVAGLTKQPHNHCYSVNASDLIQSAYKLGARPEEIDALLEKSGFLLRPAG